MKSGKIRRSSRGAKAVLIRSTGRVVRFGRNGFALFPFAIRSVADRIPIYGAVRGKAVLRLFDDAF